MKYKTNQDNNDYLMVNVKYDFAYLLVSDNLNIPTDVYNEINKIYTNSFDRNVLDNLNMSHFPDKVAILKNSLVGEYLINNSDNINIINLDNYISYCDVVNAFNISVYEDDCKMSNKILYLFKNRKYGFIEELKKEYCSDVIDYIAENRDFDTYLEKKYNAYYPGEYVIYEEDKFVCKNLNIKEKVKVKKYGD